MRSIWRTLDRSDLSGIAAVCLAVAVIGVSYGATTVTAGLPAWLPILLSVLVLAGGAEFLFVGIVAAGGSMVAAVLVGLVVNARHLPYGLSLPEVVGTGWRRVIGTHVMNDESVALALAEPDRDRRRARYWICGIGVLVAWPVGALLGVAIGAAVPDPSRFGLDAVFPAVLLALAVPALRNKNTRWAVIAGAAIAAATTPFLAAGLPVLLALPAALLAFDRTRGGAQAPPRDSEGTPGGESTAGDTSSNNEMDWRTAEADGRELARSAGSRAPYERLGDGPGDVHV